MVATARAQKGHWKSENITTVTSASGQPIIGERRTGMRSASACARRASAPRSPSPSSRQRYPRGGSRSTRAKAAATARA